MNDYMMIFMAAGLISLGVAAQIGQQTKPIATTQYAYVRDGVVMGKPRDLPSVGIRQDNGGAVLGLHGAGRDVQEACGWYGVQPSQQRVAEGQRVTGRSYVYTNGVVSEQVVIGDVKTVTPAERIEQAFAALPGTEDERVTALIHAVATTITGRVDKAITIAVPASKQDIEGRK